jgi:oligopeptide/dipeptide ABC transporter ATP-binding protein
LLQVDDLRTHFFTPAGVVPAVDGVSFDIPSGHILALVGESGCGKSLTALSILRLVPPPGRIVSGRIRFDGRELLDLPEREMRAIRGGRIAMIFQQPMTSLNPLLTIGQQVEESLRLHKRPAGRRCSPSGRDARRLTVELLRRVGLPAPEQRRREYPHQLSGGMQQRVMIAMALAGQPELLIADEPTSALDVTVQAQILGLLSDLRRERGLSLLFITHDLGVVAQIADAVCVMYAGRIVEQAPTERLFTDPRHPYTAGLLRSAPRLATPATRRLPVIPGEVPSPWHRPAGCPFHPRCDRGREDPTCRTHRPPLLPVAPGHRCACWKAPGYPSDRMTACIVSPASGVYNPRS